MPQKQKKIQKYRGITLAILGVLILSACVVNAQSSEVAQIAQNANQPIKSMSKASMKTLGRNKTESLSAVSFDGETFKVSVMSFGCTRANDFTIEYEVADGYCRVTVIRTKPDMCKRAPMLADISLAWSVPEDCLDLEVVVANPVLITREQGRLKKRAK